MGLVVKATPRPLYLQKTPGDHCIGGWVGLRTGLDGCGKSRFQRDSISGPSSLQRVAIPTALSRPTFNNAYCLSELSCVTLISHVTSIIVNCSLYLLVLCRFFAALITAARDFFPPPRTAAILNTFSGSACSVEARKRICILLTALKLEVDTTGNLYS